MALRRTSLADPALASDPEDPPGFRAALFRPGPSLGADRTGTSLYELAPGEAVCPYHFEHAEEEWLVVLSGTPSVRHPDGTDVLRPLDVVFFPPGPDGAHQVRNDADETARVLMFSEVTHPAVTDYPDSGKVGVYLRDRAQNLIVRRQSGVGYYDGEA